jgi:molybdopterin-containing oxidoreductase family iron-sulfur binding subunit
MRLKGSKVDGKSASWSEVTSKVKASLTDAKAKGGQVVVLTNTTASPSTEKLIGEFIAANPSAKHIVYDAISSSEALDAFETVYGERALVVMIKVMLKAEFRKTEKCQSIFNLKPI